MGPYHSVNTLVKGGAIKKDGVIIGYIFDVADHVQADIYQDGAWYYFYTDDKFEVVGEEENAA